MSEPYWCSSAPNVPRIWSASSLAVLAACPRKFELQYVEGWRQKGENLDFTFGSAFNDGIDEYWIQLASGATKADALDRAIQKSWQLPLPMPVRAKQAGKTHIGLARALTYYADAYEDDPSDLIRVADKPALEVPFTYVLPRVNPDGEPYKVSGFLDMLRMFAGAYTVVDYKTTGSSLTDFYFGKFEINFQNYVYSAAAQILTGHEISNFLIDAISVQPAGKVELVRRPVTLTPGEIEEGLVDVQEHIMLSEHYASRNYWPKNPEACTFCDFKNVCNKDPKLRINFLESDFEEKRRKEVTTRNADSTLAGKG